MPASLVRSGLAAALFLTASSALAADAVFPEEPPVAEEAGRFISFEIGAGIGFAPAYEGSDRYEGRFAGTGRLIELRLGRINVDDGPADGFFIGPSFRFVGEREASEDAILTGIPDTDFAFELGLKAGYEWDYARVFAAGRYGVTGHHGFVGELGADLIARPDFGGARTEISIGPRLSFADGEYFDTYFSVPATAAFLPAFNADSGLRAVGVEAKVRHDFSERWAVEAAAKYERLVGDAEDSPIVRAGSEDQYSGRLVVIRKFSIGF